jgi:hypothetical protein
MQVEEQEDVPAEHVNTVHGRGHYHGRLLALAPAAQVLGRRVQVCRRRRELVQVLQNLQNIALGNFTAQTSQRSSESGSSDSRETEVETIPKRIRPNALTYSFLSFVSDDLEAGKKKKSKVLDT